MPESSEAERNATEPLVDESAVPPDASGDETPDIDDDLPDPEIFERTSVSPDPEPTQSQCLTPTRASEGMHLVPDQSMTPTAQLGPEILPSPSVTLHVEPRGRRVRKTRRFDLGACECGHEVSNSEIEKGDAVMRCKVPGCETIWVSRHEKNPLSC
jgi:hypothetical protein